MTASVDRHEMRQVDLGINLCRGKGAVTEELLDCPKIHARFQKMGGKCVTQRMRVEMVEIRRMTDSAVKLATDRPITEAPPALVDEQGFPFVNDNFAPAGAVGEIGLEGLRRRPAEWDEALFATFAAHPNHPLTELDITEVESNEFADAEPRGVKEFHRRAVTAPRGGVGKCLKKFLDCVAICNIGCSMDVVRVGDRVCRGRLEGVLGNQEAEVRPERSERACYGARLETARVEMGEVGPHDYWFRLRRLFMIEFNADEVDKREDFAAISAERRGREIAFPLEVFQKRIDQPVPEVSFVTAVSHFRASGREGSLPKALHLHRRIVSPNISFECFTAITRDASI